METLRILLVEDDDDVAELLTLQLEFGLNAIVARAQDADDALSRLRSDTFEVVVLDIILPGTSGLTILDRLQRQEILTPVVVVTRVAQSCRVEALQLGAYAVLPKPYQRRDLLTMVQEAVGTSTVV